jgi:hypothetical protein
MIATGHVAIRLRTSVQVDSVLLVNTRIAAVKPVKRSLLRTP